MPVGAPFAGADDDVPRATPSRSGTSGGARGQREQEEPFHGIKSQTIADLGTDPGSTNNDRHRSMKSGFYTILAAQFFSALADNALLVAAISLLIQTKCPYWMTPLLKSFFVISFVVLAPFVGALADAMAKGRVMFLANAIKVAGCLLMLFDLPPLLAYAVVGLGAAAYSPAKYGILTEYLPPSKLVLANGWMEGLTVTAIVFGAALGGVLINPKVADVLLSFNFPIIDTGIDTPPEEALVIIALVYGLAALINLYIPHTGVDHKPLKTNPLFLIHDFWHSFRLLWRDRLGQISLSVTTLFWGAGATLQLLVLKWAEQQLRLPLYQAAYLQAVTAVGIAIGAVMAAKMVSLERSTRVLPVGVAMGFAVIMMVFIHDWRMSIPLLVFIGALAGYFVVPMNALLQHRGHLLMGAGHSIAVQNFNENASILVMNGVYAAMVSAGLSLNGIVILFGLLVSGITILLSRRHAATEREQVMKTIVAPERS
jgi:MFS transporter, LPLT family, lysophospholipid transporter